MEVLLLRRTAHVLYLHSTDVFISISKKETVYLKECKQICCFDLFKEIIEAFLGSLMLHLVLKLRNTSVSEMYFCFLVFGSFLVCFAILTFLLQSGIMWMSTHVCSEHVFWRTKCDIWLHAGRQPQGLALRFTEDFGCIILSWEQFGLCPNGSSSSLPRCFARRGQRANQDFSIGEKQTWGSLLKPTACSLNLKKLWSLTQM